MNSNGLIQTKQLTKVYASGDSQIKALNDVTLSLDSRRFVGITGASGSGKSTLMNLLGGLDTPSSGQIFIDGKRISDLTRHGLARFRRSTVGMIFQSFNLVSAYSALENVAFPLLFAEVDKAQRQQRATELLDLLGLAARSGHRPSELSGGEQQRVAIARALVNRPHVLLADEPTGNLDSTTSRQIMQVLADLHVRQGLTIIMISHEESLLREFAQEIITLKDGIIASHDRLD